MRATRKEEGTEKEKRRRRDGRWEQRGEREAGAVGTGQWDKREAGAVG